MRIDINKGNSTLLELTKRYQNITDESISVSVPYFINTAEQVYKQSMRDAGIDDETVKKVIQLIKNGKTPLGSGGGKGSPEQITKDLHRLMIYLGKQDYHPKKPAHIRKWMTEMHIGLDCSGYIYNILNSIEKDQEVEILKYLVWANSDETKPSHAGVFIFDSEKLNEITDFKDLKPLDILIMKDHTHVGILAEYRGALCLTDCSMGKDGITFFKLNINGTSLVIENANSWTKSLENGEIIIRRIGF